MGVRLRLTRLGRKKRPFYRIVVADSRERRDGNQIETLGYYDPLAGKDDEKRLKINPERAKYWLSVGAQPSDTVQDLLFKSGVLPRPPVLTMMLKSSPRDVNVVGSLIARPMSMLKI